MKLSIITPCKNEEKNVTKLHKKISDTLKNIKFEIIFIDDGSSDKTLEKLREIYKKDLVHTKVLSFSRNFKKEAAMLAGLEHATGEYTCIIDSDLQQNPNYLLQMLEFLENNKDYDEVAMVMSNRLNENKIISSCKKMFYKLIDSMCDVHFENAASDFRMFRSNVKEAMLSLKEKNRFSKGIFSWVGFKIKYLPYNVEPREHGTTTFNFKSLIDYALDGLFAFSTKPLKIAYACSIITFITFFIYFICMFMFKLYYAYSAIILLILFMFGLLFMLLGIIGDYLARIYRETQNRPTYIIKEKLGFNDKNIL